MTYRRRSAAYFALSIFLLGPASSINTTLGQSKTRNMPHRNQPIESRLMPGDEIVEMDYWASLHFVTHPNESPSQTVHRRVREADAIAVVRLTNVDPHLVEEGSWIRTKLAGTPEEIIKNAGLDPKRFEALVDGGEMRIKGVTVKAGSYPELQPGARYLMFIKVFEGTPWLLQLYSLEDGNTPRRPVWARAKEMPADPFENRSIDSVLAEVRSAVDKR